MSAFSKHTINLIFFAQSIEEIFLSGQLSNLNTLLPGIEFKVTVMHPSQITRRERSMLSNPIKNYFGRFKSWFTTTKQDANNEVLILLNPKAALTADFLKNVLSLLGNKEDVLLDLDFGRLPLKDETAAFWDFKHWVEVLGQNSIMGSDKAPQTIALSKELFTKLVNTQHVEGVMEYKMVV